MTKEIIEQIREEAKRYFVGMPLSHDWTHVERVYNLALKIAEKENANLFIVKLASLLHDIGRKEEMESRGEKDHTEVSLRLASEILERYQLNGQVAEEVLECISCHRFRNNEEPESLEAKVLFDADKLDCIGAIGVARAYAWAGEQNIILYSDKDFLGTGYEEEHSPMTEFTFKLSKVKDRMQTQTGRKMAQKRHKYISSFFKRLKQEIEQTA